LVNKKLETTASNIYIAGDCGGIEEASTAIEEGRIAAISAAEALGSVFPTRAATMRREAEKRLAELRIGPFGTARAKAKSTLYEEYQTHGQS
jgi:pyruvate/2-oxoglutarate dehydrogenase complex dihydrolipoamide dehydrogenase (E3) component